jgi:hypothetical protein
MMEDERAKLRKNILAFLPEPSTDAVRAFEEEAMRAYAARVWRVHSYSRL